MIVFCSLFVLGFSLRSAAMDIAKEQEIIRLWNRYRLLQREGLATDAVLRQLEKVLAERERAA
jgi:Flp pilus assembly protein TadB